MKDKLSYKSCIGSLNFSAKDRVFFGRIEGIDDLITFEGTTFEELEVAFKFMVEKHIQDCKQKGKLCEPPC